MAEESAKLMNMLGNFKAEEVEVQRTNEVVMNWWRFSDNFVCLSFFYNFFFLLFLLMEGGNESSGCG